MGGTMENRKVNRKKVKEINSIILEISSYLGKREKEGDDKDYQARKAHFVELQRLFAIHEYEQLKKHIKSGLNQFSPFFSFSTSRYYGHLKELEFNLIPENKDDEITRMKKLIDAIKSNNPKVIMYALNHGCMAVINTGVTLDGKENDGIDEGDLPCQIAIKTNSVAFFHIEQIQNVLKLAFEGGEKNLHREILMFLEKHQELKLMYSSRLGLLPHRDFDLPDQKDNTTRLWRACSDGHVKAVKELLELGADPNNKDTKGLSCLALAVVKSKNKELVSLLLENKKIHFDMNAYSLAMKNSQHKYSSSDEVDTYNLLYQHFKSPVRKYKKDIMTAHARSDVLFKQEIFLFSSIEDNPIQSIAFQLYSKDAKLEGIILEKLLNIYTDNQLLHPLLIIVGLGSAGVRNKHKHPHVSKPLKTIIDSDNKDVRHVALVSSDNVAGLYTRKSSVYVSRHTENSILGTMLHEWKHFADVEMFGNPYMALNDKEQKKYDAIIQNVSQVVKIFPAFPESNKDYAYVKNTFASVFRNYASNAIGYELLARVPEVIGILGVAKGMEWLTKYTPSLLDFYVNIYNTYLTNHIEKMRNEFSQKKDSEVMILQPFNGQ
jgi:hypothetical protein